MGSELHFQTKWLSLRVLTGDLDQNFWQKVCTSTIRQDCTFWSQKGITCQAHTFEQPGTQSLQDERLGQSSTDNSGIIFIFTTT